jgi:hypothetical protein
VGCVDQLDTACIQEARVQGIGLSPGLRLDVTGNDRDEVGLSGRIQIPVAIRLQPTHQPTGEGADLFVFTAQIPNY